MWVWRDMLPINFFRDRVRIKDWNSDQDNYLNIGVAWQKENGMITVKLSGKQLIDDAIFLNPIKEK